MGVIVQQIYYNYRLVMCTFLLAQRAYVMSIWVSDSLLDFKETKFFKVSDNK